MNVDGCSLFANVEYECVCGSHEFGVLMRVPRLDDSSASSDGLLVRCARVGCGLLQLLDVNGADNQSLKEDLECENANYAKRGWLLAIFKTIIFRHELELITDELSRCDIIVDFGCGNGEFGAYIAKRQDIRVLLVDLSQSMENIDNEPHLQYTSVKDFFSSSEYEKNLPLILCRHVLEHVADPVEFLQLLKSRLLPGGVIYIEVPNADSMWFHLFRRHWGGIYFPFHKYIFSQSTLIDCAQKAGMKVERSWFVETPTLGVTLQSIRYRGPLIKSLSFAFYFFQRCITVSRPESRESLCAILTSD
jgi:SAM-dependent methyltransferase